MSYQTILVHVDQSRHAAARIRLAARIAIAENAHLIGVALTGISRFIYQDSRIDLARTIIAAHVDTLYQEANAALARFEAAAAALGVLSYEKRLIDDEPGAGLALQARYADLAVVSQVDPSDPVARLAPDLPEYVMLNSARPLLVVPFAGAFEQLGENALVAWDESMEATRAVANALPLLRRASNVAVVLFNPAEGTAAEPGADLALFLARHGVRVELLRQRTDLDIGNALLSLAADLYSDLLVIGGFGHTRFREVLLGGVTETLLRSMTVPVLMSH